MEKFVDVQLIENTNFQMRKLLVKFFLLIEYFDLKRIFSFSNSIDKEKIYMISYSMQKEKWDISMYKKIEILNEQMKMCAIERNWRRIFLVKMCRMKMLSNNIFKCVLIWRGESWHLFCFQ